MSYKDMNIAVIGVSDRPEKFGYRIFNDLMAAGYKVTGVNPRGIEVEGRKLFKNLKDVSPKPEFVVTVVPSSTRPKRLIMLASARMAEVSCVLPDPL